MCAKKGSKVCLQDYNTEVIEKVTKQCAAENGVHHNCIFLSGSWEDMTKDSSLKG